MDRIIGLDFGAKKCGIAATDGLQIIVNAVGTIETTKLYAFFKNYMNEEDVEKLVIGLPKHKDGSDTYLKKNIDTFVAQMEKDYPQLVIDFVDERMTSVQARDIILKSGIKKTKRRDKTLVDKVSAVLILQRYLGHF
jgi:putative Holliday junction resolvase